MRKLRQWKIARSLGREHFINCDGDIDKASDELRADLESLGIAAVIIEMIIRIALEYFLDWRSKGIKRPSRLPQVGEPVYQGDE